MVMSRWLVRMMPRRRQLDKARVTVARDAPVRLASSSWVSVIAALAIGQFLFLERRIHYQ